MGGYGPKVEVDAGEPQKRARTNNRVETMNGRCRWDLLGGGNASARKASSRNTTIDSLAMPFDVNEHCQNFLLL